MCLSLCLAIAAGCGSSFADPRVDAMPVGMEVDAANIVWDCGIVLPGEKSSLAFMLDIPGVTTTGDIIKLETSCDCLVVTSSDVVLSSSDKSSVALGIVIDRSEERAGDNPTQSLGVTISIFTKYKVHKVVARVTLV